MARSVRLLTVVVLVALGLFVGKSWGGSRVPDVVVADTVEVAPADYQRIVNDLAIANSEVTGLRARIRGLEERGPTTVYVSDSVLVTDTVFVVVNERGQLTYQFATALDRPATVELRTGIDVANCDDGWQIRDRQVVCNRARFGHLWVGPELSRSPGFAAWWRPSYRSPWEVSVRWDGAWDFGVRRGVRLW